MIQNNAANREKLATYLVDGWDLDTLTGFAIETLEKIYAGCPETFRADCEYVSSLEDEKWFQEIQPEEEVET